MSDFVECESVNISYDKMGIATVNYTVISDGGEALSFAGVHSVSFGGNSFSGYVTNVDVDQITVYESAEHMWVSANITLVALA